MHKIKCLEVTSGVYEDVLVKSVNDLILAIEKGLVIPMMYDKKLIYLNAAYVISFSE